jgi:streptogramin lyase
MWPDGGEPFSMTDLYAFRDWYVNNEDMTGINNVQLLSGNQSSPWGGIAFVGGTCIEWGFSHTFYIRGTFPTPYGASNIGNWDLIVTAHEMGHNYGALDSHNYEPPIDQCGTGIPSRGTIMSYCHIYTGGTSNSDLRFHGVTQQGIETEILTGECYWFDCNENGIPDDEDIALGSSLDVNLNNIPDECEDCNGNEILDDVEIAGGESDINENGIPDICETDCNGNNLPDEYECNEAPVLDINRNNIPDVCEPDCDGSGYSDAVEILLGLVNDIDNNLIPDVCQDCNNNMQSDWLDLEREYNLFIVDSDGEILEHNAIAFVHTESYMSGGLLSNSEDIQPGPDRALYIASKGNDRIVRLDPATSSFSIFIAAGTGGLDAPASVVFTPDGKLLVSSQGTGNVLRFDGSTGSYIDEYIPAGSGGLVSPGKLIYGPNGNLFVADIANRAVLEYDGADGSFVRIFVQPHSGELVYPRGMVFLDNQDLIVTSYSNNRMLQYDGTTGEFIGVFGGYSQPGGPWGIGIGFDGSVYVSQSSNQAIVRRFTQSGIPQGYVVRNEPSLTSPTALVFMSQSDYDLDGNYVLDECDVCIDTDGDGFGDPGHPENTCSLDNCPDLANPDQADSDLDGIGDDCDDCPYDYSNDVDGDGLCADVDNCPNYPNIEQLDADEDGIGDACDDCNDGDGDGYGDPGNPWNVCPDDNCPFVYNPEQEDLDNDGIGLFCDGCVDIDGDGFGVAPYTELTCELDNCPDIYNPGQEDTDFDGVGDACCCVLRGDVDNNGERNISDLTYYVDYMFGGGSIPPCPIQGDVDGNGEMNISDLTYYVDFLFAGGPESPPCP